MATRKSRNSARSHEARTSHNVDPTAYQQAAQQGPQQQLAIAAETTSAFLRTAESLARLHLHALQRSARTWREAAQRMRAGTGPMDLLQVQHHLLTNAMMECFQFSQEFLQATVSVEPSATTTAEATGVETAEAAPTLAPGPMIQAWQAFINPGAFNGAADSTTSH